MTHDGKVDVIFVGGSLALSIKCVWNSVRVAPHGRQLLAPGAF